MFVQTETTANPARMRFLPGKTLLSAGTAGFLNKESSARSPLAQRLFEIEGIASVYLDPQAITLTKTDDVEWPMLNPARATLTYLAGEKGMRLCRRPCPLDNRGSCRRHGL